MLRFVSSNALPHLYMIYRHPLHRRHYPTRRSLHHRRHHRRPYPRPRLRSSYRPGSVEHSRQFAFSRWLKITLLQTSSTCSDQVILTCRPYMVSTESALHHLSIQTVITSKLGFRVARRHLTSRTGTRHATLPPAPIASRVPAFTLRRH